MMAKNKLSLFIGMCIASATLASEGALAQDDLDQMTFIERANKVYEYHIDCSLGLAVATAYGKVSANNEPSARPQLEEAITLFKHRTFGAAAAVGKTDIDVQAELKRRSQLFQESLRQTGNEASAMQLLKARTDRSLPCLRDVGFDLSATYSTPAN
ncbi:MAG: hypothetical protein QNJ15_06430 [Erythrobacter sp.]|nr:hypothetical protein [Erythrobacter sp.]